MHVLGTKSLMGKFMTIFVPVVLVAAVAAGLLALYMAQSALVAAEYQKLDAIREAKAERMRDYFHLVTDHAMFIAHAARIRDAFSSVFARDGERTKQVEPTRATRANPGDTETTESTSGAGASVLAGAAELVNDFFAVNEAEHGYEDCLLIDAKQGKVFLTHKHLADTGAYVKKGSLKDSGLARVFDRVVQTQKPSISDIGVYPIDSAAMGFCGAPVFDKDGQLVGVIALRFNTREINATMQLTDAAGATADAFLAGPDLSLRSVPRLDNTAVVLKTRVDTAPVKLGLQQKTGHMTDKDLRRDDRLISYGSTKLSKSKDLPIDFDWAIVVGIDRTEALRVARSLGYRVVSLAAVAGIIVCVTGFLLARAVAKPVLALAGQASQISQGDLTVQVEVRSRNDEIGILQRAFASMVDSLRSQTRQTLEGINVLASSAAEISATVRQLSASTTKTSSAVAETSTTVEEVKQAAKLSSDKAKSVSASSRSAVSISEHGRKATEDTIQKMNVIKEQMESVGETVVRLSDHSRAIEDIISTVQDLADQSNLLAVNASIEAARAGDQGKSFAVVAHEIKSMADQSKDATEQIRRILQETQKWVSAVVMATEQGIKAVDAGVQQSLSAGDSIKALSASVAESSQAAGVITSSTEQQFIGVDQVASAMSSIEAAMRQNLSGTLQLEASAKRLEDLGDQLKHLVDRYNI